MSSCIKIWVHFVWTVKNRRNLLNRNFRYRVFNHIKENAGKKNIHIQAINGAENHIHILVRLRSEQSAAQIAFHIKGESSRWINKKGLTKTPFKWQKNFMALSVSEKELPRICAYIQQQETHHGIK